MAEAGRQVLSSGVTLGDIARFAQTPRDRVAVAVLQFRFGGGPYQKHSFNQIVVDALDLITSEMSASRDQISEYDEDQLTDKVVFGLRMLGLTATRETANNGHCDVSINDQGFTWLGEAKIYKGYDYLLKGFQQLCDRYATGLPDHDHGALIVYFKTPGIKRVMDEWRDFLFQTYNGMTGEFSSQNPLVLNTAHPHHITDLPYNVRHVPIPVMHDPSDVKPRAKRQPKSKTTKKPSSASATKSA